MDGKIIRQHALATGENILLRYPTIDDTAAMLDYINTLSKEQTFILMQGEQLAFEEEQAFIEESLIKIRYGKKVLVLTFVNDELIGIAGIDLKTRAEKHVGIFGISVAKEHRGKGVGKILMQTTLEEAKRYMPELRIVTLGVFGNNPLAKHMYETFGFKEYGNLPKGAIHRGEYVDHIEMYKEM